MNMRLRRFGPRNLTLYNLFLKACARSKPCKLLALERSFKELLARGLEPDRATFAHLREALGDQAEAFCEDSGLAWKGRRMTSLRL